MLPLQIELGPRWGRKRKNYVVWEIEGGREGGSRWNHSDVVLLDSHFVETDGDVVEKQSEVLKSSDYKNDPSWKWA